MKDIKKPNFMKAAIQTRSHNAVLEVLIALLVMFIGEFLMGILQVPMLVVYLLGNAEYREMVLQYSVDLDKITRILQNTPEWFILVNLVLEVGLIAIFILYCRFFEKRKANTLGFCKKKCVVEYLKGILIGAAAFVAAYAICLLTGSVKIHTNVITGTTVFYVIGFFIGYLIQGMAEEVICRGYFMVSLTRRYHVSTAVLMSAVLFSMLHGSNPGITFLAYINIFLFGIFLSLLFVRYENIWIVGAVHSIWNFLQGNVFGVQVSGMSVQTSLFGSNFNENVLMNGGSFGMEGGFAVTLVLLAANALILWNMSKHDCFVQAEPVDNPYDREAFQKMFSQQTPYPGNGQDTFYRNDSHTGQNANNFGQGPYYQENEAPEGYQQENRWQQAQATQTEKKDGYENMGVNPEETPWRPKNEWEQENTRTVFDQNYFKD